ncbi:MAG TPA: sulfate adenylyltransferase subunit CysD [Elusimicrobiota bacterium]|nr:sulfate adenylyltransferase subunit CysD [Elusimicrobiota bacterium]
MGYHAPHENGSAGVSQLRELEAESIYILREAAAQARRPCLLFSGGKDSTVIVHLAAKAFRPGRLPFPLLHVDTGHNFPETLTFRDGLAAELGEELLVRRVQDSIDRGRAVENSNPRVGRNALQSITLLEAIAEMKFDCVIGGARRDEEKARAKERIFSFRDEFGQWEPRTQRPEVWNLYNGRVRPGEHMRVFPLSNWTELDIWAYIREEKIPLPSIYFSHERRCVRRADGTLLAACDNVKAGAGETEASLRVRCRTVGDMTCTGLVESEASTIDEVIGEIAAAATSERGTRFDDKVSDSAMEDRKRQGYF